MNSILVDKLNQWNWEQYSLTFILFARFCKFQKENLMMSNIPEIGSNNFIEAMHIVIFNTKTLDFEKVITEQFDA